ncbi:MAG: drug/metabolite exporter YedA [Pirellulales bacterium]
MTDGQCTSRGEPSRCSRLALVAGMLVIYVVWGSTYLAIRWGVETMPPFLMAGARFLLAGGILYAWLRLRGAPRPELADWKSAVFLGALLLLGGNGLVTWAEQWLPSGVAALIITTTPLWMMLFDWLIFHGPRPRAVVWLGVALGFVGVTLLIQPQAADDGAPRLWAVLAMCAAPVVWSLGSLFSQRARRLDPPLLNTSLQMLCGGGLMFVVGLGLGEAGNFDPAAVSTRSWLSFAYLVTFGSLLAFTTYMWLLRVARPSVVSTYAYVNPLVAVFLGAAIGGEVLTANVGLATVLILGAVALIAIRRRSPKPTILKSEALEPRAANEAAARAKVRLAQCKG